MSLFNVYCKDLSDKLLPELLNRLNEYEMIVDLHPNFSFSNPNGFFQFKFKLTNPHLEALDNKEFIADFEYFISDFDFKSHNRHNFDDFSYSNLDIQNKLEFCDTKMSFIWSGGNDFQFRFAFLTSAILTELTTGIWCYPEDIIWHDSNTILYWPFERIKEYEKAIIKFQSKEFSEWK